MTQIIGIHGIMGSGKSTFANLLSKKLEGTVTILPFAKSLKDFALALGWDGEKNEKGRRLLQLLGTDVGRQCISETIWIEKWVDAVMECGSDFIIADDMRFENELDVVKEFEGYKIKIDGRGYHQPTWMEKKFPFLKKQHASEVQISDSKFDILVDNSGEVKHLDDYLQLIKEKING